MTLKYCSTCKREAKKKTIATRLVKGTQLNDKGHRTPYRAYLCDHCCELNGSSEYYQFDAIDRKGKQ